MNDRKGLPYLDLSIELLADLAPERFLRSLALLKLAARELPAVTELAAAALGSPKPAVLDEGRGRYLNAFSLRHVAVPLPAAGWLLRLPAAPGLSALVMLSAELLDRLKGLPAYRVLDPAGILGRDIRRDSELDEELRDDDMPLVG